MTEKKEHGCFWCTNRKGMKCKVSSVNMKNFFKQYPDIKSLSELVKYEGKLIYIGCKCSSFEEKKIEKVTFT